MHIGLLQVELYLPGNHSLKGKRQILRSLKDRIRNKANVSVAEIDHHDAWQTARLAIITVGTDHDRVSQILTSVLKLVDSTPNSEIVKEQIEML